MHTADHVALPSLPLLPQGVGARRPRVASVPAGHVYVRHCSPVGRANGIVRLRDPRPDGAPSTSQRWWPPVMLDPDWVGEHHDQFNLFHLHFGFDAQGPAALSGLVAALRRYGKPLIYTVHDTCATPVRPIRRRTWPHWTC
ncbi:hypothetical protein ACICHK_37955 [Streptomyces sp. AHU1]|uniref:hypothetical protein n=1 Tax=Streptomyces sp. AHU1 TaxID=3377215 RepID=UPI003878041C